MLRVGGQVGEFQIRRLIGRGGMGEVYEAFEPGLGRLVALKVLPEWLADDPQALDRFQREAATAAQLEHPRIVPIFFWGQADGQCFFTMKLIQGVPLSRFIRRRRLLEQIPRGTTEVAKPDAETPRSPAASTDEEKRQTDEQGQADSKGEEDEKPQADEKLQFDQNGQADSPAAPADAGASVNEALWGSDLAGPLTEPGETVLAETVSAGMAPDQVAAAELHRDLSELFEDYCENRFEFAARVGEQLAEALDYAHRQGQIHRDFKPSNVMIDRHGDVYLIDFGLTRAITPDATRHLCGTLRYMSPEQLDLRPLDGRSDIYSLGVTLYEIVSPQSAFDGEDESAIAEQIRDGAVQPLELAVPEIPERLAHCIRRAMHPQPEARYETAADLRPELAACRRELGGAAESVARRRRRLAWEPSLMAVGCLLIAMLAGGLTWQLWSAAGAGARIEGRFIDDAGITHFKNSIGMEFVVVRPGVFRMGSEEAEMPAALVERPDHKVHITKEFMLGVYEVTQKQYLTVMGENPSQFTAERLGVADAGAYPVHSVSWKDAQRFCQKLSNRTAERAAGCRYRLPTEAEWEYACRAGTESPFSFGFALSSDQANVYPLVPLTEAEYAANPPRPKRVGSYRPNAFGLYDMHGNVAEWCQDIYDEYTAAEQYDPVVDHGPRVERIIRGGFFSNPASGSRSAARDQRPPDLHLEFAGLRVVCDIPEKD